MTLGSQDNSLSDRLDISKVSALSSEAWLLRDTDPTRARSLSQIALSLAGSDATARAWCLTVLSFLAMRQNHFDTSLELAFEASSLFANALHDWGSRLHNVIAVNFAMLGEPALALDYFLKALSLAQQLDSAQDLYTAYHDLALYYRQRGDMAQSLSYMEKAQSYVGGDPDRQVFTLKTLAYHHLQEQDFLLARDYAEQALKMSKEHALIRAESFSLEVLAELALAEKAYTRALELYEAILIIQRHYDELTYTTLLSMANIYVVQHRWLEATNQLTTVLAEVPTSDKVTQVKCHQLLYQVAKAQNNMARALYHHEQFHSCQQTIFNEENEIKVRALDVAHRMDTLRQESELLNETNKQLEAQYKELQALHDKVRELSIRDELTGLYNRRYLFEQADGLLRLARRYQRPISIAMLDIDHFKAINDSYGHTIGDYVIKQVAEVLKRTLRDADPIARYGGEEFAVIMPETTLNNAIIACERLQTAMHEQDWHRIHPDVKISASIGIVCDPGNVNSGELFSLADDQLYRAKREGRNKICWAEYVEK